jgi:hypothetical protein
MPLVRWWYQPHSGARLRQSRRADRGSRALDRSAQSPQRLPAILSSVIGSSVREVCSVKIHQLLLAHTTLWPLGKAAGN